jgi:hypothetical protein
MKNLAKGEIPPSIKAIDLTIIKKKLLHPSTNEDWTAEEFDKAEIEYKKFLTLHYLHPNANLVPTGAIDEIWHNHILNTRKYAEDCENAFGHFLHHFPSFGLNGKEDEEKLEEFYTKTASLFNQHFEGDYKTSSRGAKCRICGSTPSRIQKLNESADVQFEEAI